MKTKTLKTIQVLSKIGKVLSIIAFVLSLVGGIGSIVGIISLACIPEGLKIGGMTIHGIIEQNSNITMGTLYAAMAVTIAYCAGCAVQAKFAQYYFTNELKAGNPFTFKGARELIRLGIIVICVSVGATILAAIMYAVVTLSFAGVADMDFSNSSSIGLGIMLIIAGLLCRHGAEVSIGTPEEKNENTDN